MAGHLSGVYVDRKTQIGAAALTNSTTRGDMEMTAIKLAAKTIELWPEPIEPWQPEAEPPARRPPAARPLVVGGQRVRVLVGGRRAARKVRVAAAPRVAATIFERDGDGWRAAPAASAASGCASTASGWSGRATRSRASRSRSPSRRLQTSAYAITTPP